MFLCLETNCIIIGSLKQIKVRQKYILFFYIDPNYKAEITDNILAKKKKGYGSKVQLLQNIISKGVHHPRNDIVVNMIRIQRGLLKRG